MFLRRTTVRSPGGRTYHYTHLVESYRRKEDGAPRHRVLANLGEISDQEVENLKLALAANKAGKRVVLAKERRRSASARSPKPQANLRYLDVAVGLELWREWGLQELLTDLLPRSGADVADADVICALALQRLIDPGSKLLGTRWFPRTALPELLGVPKRQFNNTRLHRALQALEECRLHLMGRLPLLYQNRRGAFASLFLDLTDTWFVGQGPELATRGKTKEGRVERKIGIALLCNEAGFPIRWEVVSGTRAEPEVYLDLLSAIAGLDWASDVPLVVDRAMGCSSHVRRLLDLDLRFLTALRIVEFPAYTEAVPHEPIAALEPEGESDETTIAAARARISEAGLQVVEPNLLVVDLGIIDLPAADESPPGEREHDRRGGAIRVNRGVPA